MRNFEPGDIVRCISTDYDPTDELSRWTLRAGCVVGEQYTVKTERARSDRTGKRVLRLQNHTYWLCAEHFEFWDMFREMVKQATDEL